MLDPHFSILGFRTLYEKRREQRDGSSGRSFLLPRFPRRPGNVEVGPLVLARESRKETGGGDTTRSASADICKIGEVAFQLFLIILPQWQPPLQACSRRRAPARLCSVSGRAPPRRARSPARSPRRTCRTSSGPIRPTA